MRTQLDQIVDSLVALRREATGLQGRDHKPSECNSLLRDAGANLEIFLKTAIYPPGTRRNLKDLIEGLIGHGVTRGEVAALHDLRKKYNAAKHDATYVPTVADVTSVLRVAIDTLTGWRGRQLGQADSAATPGYCRRVWLASWDHFIHGDGEIQVFLPVDPDEYDRPPSIDLIYLKGLSWPDVLKPLGSAIVPPIGAIPDKFLACWAAEGDFAGARAFDGEYRALLHTLAGEELRLDIMPFLKRENDATAMHAAVAFSAVDVARTLTSGVQTAELFEAILRRAATAYAVPRTGRLSQGFAAKFCELLMQAPDAVRQVLSGPRFVAARTFGRLQHTAYASDDSALVSSQNELIVNL